MPLTEYCRQTTVQKLGWRAKKTQRAVSHSSIAYCGLCPSVNKLRKCSSTVTPSGGSDSVTGPRDSVSPAVPAIDR